MWLDHSEGNVACSNCEGNGDIFAVGSSEGLVRNNRLARRVEGGMTRASGFGRGRLRVALVPRELELEGAVLR
jgi:hypothetical protein